jgi:hypothetical protein
MSCSTTLPWRYASRSKVAPDFTDEELRSVSVAVLILDGAEEEFVKPEDTKRMAELIPGRSW